MESFRGADANGTSYVLFAFTPFSNDGFNDDVGGFIAFPSIERGKCVREGEQNGFVFVKVRGEPIINFIFEVGMVTRVAVVGFAKPTKQGCIELGH